MSELNVIEMHQNYPFGKFKTPLHNSQRIEVKEKIIHQNFDDFQAFRKKVLLRKKLEHESLIRLNRIVTKSTNKTMLFYEYVPIAFQSWVSCIGQKILQELSSKMLSLVEYICSQNILFKFEPQCMGLDQNANLKYFLRTEKICIEQKADQQKISKQIKDFFRSLNHESEKEQLRSTNISESKSSGEESIWKSVSFLQDRKSWQQGDDSNKYLITLEKSSLSSRINLSMKKSKDALHKWKEIRGEKKRLATNAL